ncbi:oligosaccharide flippase family protein [Ectopseudomonas mendocina]|uniref:Oligosaccharide flippase family protein n=1 Tax=Ectopseudomonas mendocina TaxID=300 RepID=A0ABZ2RJU3_ECTME
MALQIANAILPFVLIPYLTRTLGLSLYGVVALGMAIVQLACVLTDFGFNLSATHRIASNFENTLLVRKIASAVSICKLVLLIPIVAFIYFFLSFQEQSYGGNSHYFWLLLIPIIGQTFQPIWLFQGIERMGYISLCLVLARSSYVLLTLLWVTSSSDYLWVAVANGVAQLAAASIATLFMFRLGYWPIWPGIRFIRETFNQSVEFFWSRAAVATYTAGGAFYLGLVAGPTAVAYYSAAEQLYKGAQALFQPLSQALYPYMTKTRDTKLFFRILKIVVLLSILGLIVGLLIGEWFLVLLFGSEYSHSFPILAVFMVAFCITMPSILLGYPFLGALGDNRSANLSVIYGGLLQVVILFIIYLVGWTSEVVVVGSVMSVEVFVLAYRAFKAKALVSFMCAQEDAR